MDRRSRKTWLLGALALLAAVAARAENAFDIVIADVTIVDAEHDRLLGSRDVVVKDGYIAAIGKPSQLRVAPGARRVDGHGAFLIPGLVDMHVHLFNNVSHRPPNTWAFALFVANGVTAVREMAGTPDSMSIVEDWRKQIADGTLVAPRIVAAGVVAWGPSPAAAVTQVDAAAHAHADFVKVFSDISEPTWRAIVGASARHGLPLIGHVPAGVPVIEAAKAGQRSDEHLMQIFEACSTLEDKVLEERRGLSGDALTTKSDDEEARVLDAYDQQACDRTAAALAATTQVQVPTLVLPHAESLAATEHPDHDSRWRYLRADEQARWLRVEKELTPEQRAVGAKRWPVARKIVATLHKAGAPLLAGTDTPMPGVYPGFSLHEEMELLVESGLSPAEALRAATSTPATFLSLANEGPIATGRRADLVLLDANPLRDIRNTRRIRAVVLGGRMFDRAALDGMLARAAAEARGN